MIFKTIFHTINLLINNLSYYLPYALKINVGMWVSNPNQVFIAEVCPLQIDLL